MVMQSYVPFLSSMYRAVLSDISNQLPTLSKDCERDLKRLLSLIKTRGLPVLLVDLPAFGKHFDKCLSNGRLLRPAMACFSPYRRRGVVPSLFKGLLLRVFDEHGMLRSSPDVLSIRAIRQLCRMAKKFKIQCPDKTIKEHVNEFVKTDEECRLPTLDWSDPDFPSLDPSRLRFGDIWDSGEENGNNIPILPARIRRDITDSTERVFDIIACRLGNYSPGRWVFKHGPGAVSDDPGGRNYKYNFANWSRHLERVFPLADFAFANFGLWADSVVEGGEFSDSSLPSRLIAVPKTLDAPRLIAAEPKAHQWCQQSIKDFFYKTVNESWMGRSIFFKDQTHNQRLALTSSHSGSHATIDLSSASDRISCWLVERAMRKNPHLLSALWASRTNHVQLIGESSLLKTFCLRKFSTMGSAVTFPIQSILFLGIVLSAICFRRGITPTEAILKDLAREVRVFGDDLIVPIDAWHEVVGLLHLYGLKVNPAKTFGAGKFRESCGVEAYDGCEVTSTYILGLPTYKRPESIVSAVDTIKNLCRRGYLEAAAQLQRTLPKRFTFASIDVDSDSFGIPNLLYTSNPHMRVNPHTQVREQKVHVPVVKQERKPAQGGPMVLQYFTEACKAKFVQGERLGLPSRSKQSLMLRWVEC